MQMMRMKYWLVILVVMALCGCADDGDVVRLCANPDLDCNDSNACTLDRCDPVRGCLNEPVSCNDGDVCTVDSCDSAIGCVTAPVSCNDRDACTADSCDPSMGCLNTEISASCDDSDLCTTDSCDPSLGCVNATMSCDDGNECTAESCDSMTGCSSVPVAMGTPCDRGLGACLNGVCEAVACSSDANCNDSDACTMDRCDLSNNMCVNTDITASCDDGNACTDDSCAAETGCVNTDNSANCDDGEECTAESCDPSTGCSSEPVLDGTVCDGGAGVCSGGSCLSTSEVEYMQDFEALDQMDVNALGDDGWIVFGSVFDPAGNFLFGYGTFAAPNDGSAFSAIVRDQGGPDQGSQQVSIYSDYNNTDHALGNTIEASVFRERTITAADVGRTILFSFDAKAGNINNPGDALCPCSSTAFAFIKTIDPSSNFDQTNNVREITTALPDSWGRFEIRLPIDAGLVGQLLQVGFATTATLFEPSANFYDNVEIGSAATAQ